MSSRNFVRPSRASFIAPTQPQSGSLVIFDGWRNFSVGEITEQHHVLVIEHVQIFVVEIIVYNEALNTESPRIYLNLNTLVDSFSQNEMQEKFSDIRKMLLRQRHITQIVQYITSRLTIPKYEIREEFAAIMIPKDDDTTSSVIPPDVIGQFNRPRELVPFETARPQPVM